MRTLKRQNKTLRGQSRNAYYWQLRKENAKVQLVALTFLLQIILRLHVPGGSCRNKCTLKAIIKLKNILGDRAAISSAVTALLFPKKHGQSSQATIQLPNASQNQKARHSAWQGTIR